MAATTVAALAVAATGASGQHPTKPPVIEPLPVANFSQTTSGVGFGVTVHGAKSVTIRFGDRRRKAKQLTRIGGPQVIAKFNWQAFFNPTPRKRCYHITVVARNVHGTVTRNRKACRLGVQSQDVR